VKTELAGLKGRFWKIVLMFASFGWDFRRLKNKKWSSEEEKERVYRSMYRRQAVKFRETAVELGGLLIKLGQFFSSRVDLLPQEYTDELAKLQDQVPPAEAALVVEQLERELGQPVNGLFAEFSREPLAAASLGQVHEARLHSGERVAVKVLRPGIEEIVATDLRAIRVVLKGLQKYTDWVRNIDVDAIYTEFKETIEEELNYRLEGGYADRFRENFAEDELIKVPKVYWDYTTQRVIVLEFMEGTKINDYQGLEALGWRRADLAQLLIETYLKQVLVDGFFHADPHPGNLMVTGDGKLVYLDFGMMGEVSPKLKAAVGDAVVAIIAKDGAALVEAFDRIGFLRPQADRDALTRVVEALLDRYYNQDFGRGHDVGHLADDLRDLFYNEPFQLPAKVTFLGRALVTVLGITTGLNPEIDYLKVIKPYLDDLYPQGSRVNLLLNQGKKILGQVAGLPEKVDRVIRRLESGKLRVRTGQEELNALYAHQARLANRIVLAILLGAGAVVAVLFFLNGFVEYGQGMVLAVTALTAALLENLWSGRNVDRFERFQKRHRKSHENEPVGLKRPKLRPEGK